MRKRLAFVFALTSICLAIALYGVDARGVLAALAGFPTWRIPLVAGLYLVVLVARAERFRRLVPTPVPFRPMLAIVGAGALAINVVPLRMGELVRPYLLAQRGVPYAESLAAVVVERLLDMLALLALVALAAGLVDVPSVVIGGVDLLVVGRRTVTAAIAAIVALLVLLRVLGAFGRSAHHRLPARLVPLASALDRALRGLFARTPRDVAVLLACTAISWLGSIAACGVAMGGFDALSTSAAHVAFDWATTVSALVLVPTPGFLGSFEAGAIGGLVALGNDADVARAFALTLHAIQFGTTLATGLLGYAALGTSLRSAVAESRETPSS